MRRTTAALAWTIAGCVVVQASAIAFAFGGVLNRISNGDVVDRALLEAGESAGSAELGFWVHGIVGGVVIPLLALALLVVSFFTRARGVRLWATVTFVLVLLQVTLGFSVTDVPSLGLIHGANALAVVLASVLTALRARRVPVAVGATDRAADGATTRDRREAATTDAVAP